MPNPVSEARIQVAKDFGLENVDEIAITCREANVSFSVACALFQKESGGRNVYGHDAGGALSGFEKRVTKGNFEVFYWLVFDKGQTSNGVGPAQITWKGFFTDMLEKKLKPWNVHDNMLYGLQLLRSHYDANGKSWKAAGARYNGAEAYGVDLEKKIGEWKTRFKGL
jgi:hypothetical protein